MKKNIGFIGLGIMGRPMAINLIKKGEKLLVFDINDAAVKEAVDKGAEFATPKEIGEKCEVVFLILPNGKIVTETIFGDDGVLCKMKKGSVVVDMSSVSFEETKICYDGLAEYGIDFLDAPVSGGEPKAIDGTLAFMVGGKQTVFDRVLPLFEKMGASAVLTGESGSGSITKLVNQIIVNMNIATLSEAMVFATKAGANPESVYKAIRGGLAGSVIMDAKAPMMYNRDFKPGGKISINHKDIKNVINTAHAMDIPVPFTAQLFEILQSLKIKGCFNDDHSAIVKHFESIADIEVTNK